MADMVDCGRHCFEAWARQTPSPAYGYCWYNRWLGEFNPQMTADAALERLQGHKHSQEGRLAFKRGWERAQAEYMAMSPPAGEMLALETPRAPRMKG